MKTAEQYFKEQYGANHIANVISLGDTVSFYMMATEIIKKTFSVNKMHMLGLEMG